MLRYCAVVVNEQRVMSQDHITSLSIDLAYQPQTQQSVTSVELQGALCIHVNWVTDSSVTSHVPLVSDLDMNPLQGHRCLVVNRSPVYQLLIDGGGQDWNLERPTDGRTDEIIEIIND